MKSADRNPQSAEHPPFSVDFLHSAPTQPAGIEPDLPSQLDDITQLACALCGAPVGLVCSRDQQGWRLSHHLGTQQEPLTFDLAFYTFAVTQRRAFEISDLRSEPAFSASPLVSGAPHFRFFAGSPVTSPDGQLLGAICILDTRTRSLTTPQRQGLDALARQVRAHLQYQKSSAAQREMQAVSREQQRQWARVFECASIGMAEVNPDGTWSQVNGAFCAMLGYSESELMQLAPGDVIHPDDVNSSMSLLRKTLAGEIPSCCGEKRLIHKTGRVIWCGLHVTLVRNTAGAPAYFLAHVTDVSEARAAQEGLRNSELHLKTLLELPAPMVILTTDEEGGITYLNRFGEQFLGYAADEVVGKGSILPFFLDTEIREHGQEHARFFGTITHGAQTVLEHARVVGSETREWTWLKKDGAAVRVSVMVNTVKDASGKVTGFAISATPVAKPNEGAPGTVEGRFRTVADSAPLGMFLTDSYGTCTYVNEAFHQMTGLGTAEASGEGWYGAFAQAERTQFYNEFQKAMRRGSDFCMEVRLGRSAGGWARVRGREIFFDDVAQGYVGTVEDISATRLLLDKLKGSEERLRNLLTMAPFPVALIDRDRKCLVASVGWLELHHRSWHDVNSQNIFDFLPDARERLEDLCRRALNGATQLVHEQNIRMHDEGSAEWIRWQLFPWRVGGEICGVGIFEERLTHHLRLISEAEAAREAAESASRVKSEFLAEVSQELRTPGNGIIGLTDILLEGESNPQRREYMEMIKTSTGSLLKLAREIYDFSKMESRKLELEILPFNLVDGLNQAMRRMAVAAENKGLELICQTSPDLPTVVVGDGGRLFQIVSHLTAFAIDITMKGEIAICVNVDDHAPNKTNMPGVIGFHFVVRDTAGWLSDAKLADIQQVLMMVENSPALKKAGTSLGLVLSARLVNLMGGKLWVERGEQGAAFHFTVPMSGKRQPPIVSEVLRDASILVAADNLTRRRWLQELLTSWGMKPTALEKPGALMDVLEIAEEAGRPFQFALLDAHIPDRDTFSFAAQMKTNERTAKVVPVMMLSASMRVADESRARELGLEHTVIKPVNANELHELLERLAGGDPAELTVEPGKLTRNVLPKPRWNVLLVDDSRFNQEVAMGVFGQQGHRVTIARNGREAMAILQRRTCDVVLIGLDMPNENALETLAAIRQREKERQKPVMVFGVTSDPGYSDREPALKEITNGFLASPIQPRDLTLLLEQVAPALEQY